jgi:hypothetical protein
VSVTPLARKHGGAKRRLLRKIHIGVDEQALEIRAIEVTGSYVRDAPMLPELLDQIPRRCGDGSSTETAFSDPDLVDPLPVLFSDLVTLRCPREGSSTPSTEPIDGPNPVGEGVWRGVGVGFRWDVGIPMRN